jgi:hypothetical protein
VRAGHLAAVADAFVKRGEAVFGFGAGRDCNESKRSQERTIQDGTIGALRPPDKFRSGVPVPRDIFAGKPMQPELSAALRRATSPAALRAPDFANSGVSLLEVHEARCA